MIVLGLLLVLLALGLLLAVMLGGADDRANYVVGGLELQVSTMAVFLLGALMFLVFVLGFSLIRSGSRRAAQRRKDQKELDRLNAKLEKQERGDPAGHSESTGKHEADQPTRESGPKT